MKHIFFLVVFLCTVAVHAQIEVGNNLVSGKVDTTRTIQNISLKSRVRVPVNAFVFNLGYQVPWLTNAATKADFWSNKVGTGIDFSVDYRRQFQKKVIEKDEVVSLPTCFAFGIGLGINFIHKTSYFENFSETLHNYIDIDNDNCTIMLNYNNVKESVSLTYLDIPLYLEIGKLGRIKPSACFNLGVKASVLVAKRFVNEGTYTSTGYYPKWDVTIHDVPVLGYYTNAQCYENPEQNVSPFVLWGMASAGVNIPFSSFEKNKIAKWILRLSAKVDYSLTPVSKVMDDSYFKGAAFRLNQVNMLSNGNRIFSAGFSIGMIYCL
jgi:hypothetical protein